MKNEYFECACNSDEHRLVFTIDEGEKDWPPEVWAGIFLCQHDNIFKRIYSAIKYVFGYKSRYGHFGCYAMKPEDAVRFQLMIEQYINKHNEWIKIFKE